MSLIRYPNNRFSINVTPGRCNNPKGILQTLFERGHIDSSIVTKLRVMRHSKDGEKEDENKDTREVYADCKKYSLTHLLSNCKDCFNQKTNLKELANELSISMPNITIIIFTPKFSCELAGKGIEYSWGASKRIYRCQPISLK